MSEQNPQSERERVDAMKQRLLPVMEGPREEEVNEYTVEGDNAPDAPVDPEALRPRIVEELKTVYDPEIPVNIYDLGLIYGFDIEKDGAVELQMTLTAPGCPVAGVLVRQVAERVGAVSGVSRAHVELVWEPPWTMDRMSEEAKLELGLL